MDGQNAEITQLLDQYISPTVRKNIENDYYEKINEQATLNEVIKNPIFLSRPFQHVALSTDHGVIHVRDVASRVVQLLTQLNGVHFPKRNTARLEFMKGYGVMLAYVHDIGMLETKDLNKNLHAEYAAQAMFNDYFDKQITTLWEENSGNVAWRITKLALQKVLTQPPRHVMREMLALCCAHAKETISNDLLSRPSEFRRAVQEIVGHQLEYRWLQTRVEQTQRNLVAIEQSNPAQRERFLKQKTEAEAALDNAIKDKHTSAETNEFLKLFYADYWQDSFQWLVSTNSDARELVDDVLDTIRTLRCANASRQRGTRLRATGGYQIFLDHHSANALYAINAGDRLFLLESKDTLLAGEVNLASTEFTQSGDLRISFYRGSFGDPTATERAVFNAAVAINEVQQDMIGSFSRPATTGEETSGADYIKKWQTTNILLENSDDNPTFTPQVHQQLTILNPKLKTSIQMVPSLQNVPELERNLYLSAKELDWDYKARNDLLTKISQSGHKITHMKVDEAFSHVRHIELKTGETLVRANTLASFVYIPLSEGLIGTPEGGYQPFHARPYIPLGNVGVIRGDIRNATITAEKPVDILIIPRETYLQFWHHTYTEEEFRTLLKTIEADKK